MRGRKRGREIERKDERKRGGEGGREVRDGGEEKEVPGGIIVIADFLSVDFCDRLNAELCPTCCYMTGALTCKIESERRNESFELCP